MAKRRRREIIGEQETQEGIDAILGMMNDRAPANPGMQPPVQPYAQQPIGQVAQPPVQQPVSQPIQPSQPPVSQPQNMRVPTGQPISPVAPVAGQQPPAAFGMQINVPTTESNAVSPERLVGLAINIGKRSYQQDAIITTDPNVSGHMPERWMATLCDGMGGMNGGEKASALGVRLAVEKYRAYGGDDFATFYRELIADIDYAVSSLEDEKGNFLGAGSTFISMLYNKGMWHFASVGDSHIYIIREGVINMVVREHNYLADLLEMAKNKEISYEEAYNDKSKDALTSYMGMGGVNLMDINSAVAMPEDIIVLCSDGLYRTCSDAEIMQIIMMNKGDMQAAADTLINYALSKNNPYQDNLSVILGRLK